MKSAPPPSSRHRLSTKPRLYIETSVVSYLTARPSANPITLERQKLTAQWWRDELPRFTPVISAVVIEEAAHGDPQAAAARVAALEGFEILDIADTVRALAERLVLQGGIPPKAANDAIHIATCAVHAIPHLLTWNFHHIANPHLWTRLEAICKNFACPFPQIFSPLIP